MHISKVMAEDFKRFTKLEILDIPATAKLVILAGANGNGKSSLFDVFVKYFDRHSGFRRGVWLGLGIGHTRTIHSRSPAMTRYFGIFRSANN
jgi:recombinational DNA repair ATPase RecF